MICTQCHSHVFAYGGSVLVVYVRPHRDQWPRLVMHVNSDVYVELEPAAGP
jgi:hypothetical protein